ncbi:MULTISPECIES: helix-turn-helix transcriptional regulator [Streptomyces]|uniref:helix-turn-helix transcriptional regulator n=1 Tax=Streptomyces TaxID=1883 RepID=UPI00386662EE
MKNGSDRNETPTAHRATGVSALPHAPDEQSNTRRRVARSILDHGPSTAAQLADRLGLTQAAVRRHLDALVADALVEPREKRVYGSRGRGRPAKVFAITDLGRDAFDQAYDELAVEALRWIERAAGGGDRGAAAVLDFARARAAAQAERYRSLVERVPPEERARALAEALSRDGYAAAARGVAAPAGQQLCQHHCPVAHAAASFPQLCEAETEVFSELLGSHVQRLATIAHGDGVCTTFVPDASAAAPADGGAESRRPAGGPRPRGTPADGTHRSTVTPPKTTAQARTAGRNPA